MTEQEYQDKISRYQKKIRFHKEAISNIEKKMDRMESDRQQAMLKVGKYVRYRHGKTTTASYLKVENFQSSKRGFKLLGRGFNYSNGRLSYIDVIYCGWDEISYIVDIDEKKYTDELNKILNGFVNACTKKYES